MSKCTKEHCIFKDALGVLCTLRNCSHKTSKKEEDMDYLGNMLTVYANAWLEKNNLPWTEENWRKATQWANSHSAQECRQYIVNDLKLG